MRSFEQLETAAAAWPPAPTDRGEVRLCVRRLPEEQREVPGRVRLDPERGLEGDRWASGAAEPDRQITLMSYRAAALVADGQPEALTGDNLLVTLELGEANLPVGTRLRVGRAELEVSAEPHTGCRKFSRRFGQDALRWVNGKARRHLRLRGVNCRVLVAGEVWVGAPVAVLERPR